MTSSPVADWSQRRPYNAVADFVDANARRHADKVAFIEGQRTLTYGALAAATCRLAHGLVALGLRPESRIVLLLLDTVDYPVAFWGALRAGIVPIPLNTLLTSEQYAYILEDSRAEAILISPALIKSIEPILDRLTRLRTAIVVGPATAGAQMGRLDTRRFDDVLGGQSAEPW